MTDEDRPFRERERLRRNPAPREDAPGPRAPMTARRPSNTDPGRLTRGKPTSAPNAPTTDHGGPDGSVTNADRKWGSSE